MGKASLAILTLAALAACSTTSSSPPRRADHQRDTELTLARTGGTTASGGRGAAALEAALAPDSSQAQWTIPAKNYASTATADSTRSTSPTSPGSSSPSPSRRASPGDTRRPRSWSAGPCTSSRRSPTRSTRSTCRAMGRRANGSSPPRPPARRRGSPAADVVNRREHHHGSAGGEGQRPGGKQRRGIRRPRMAHRARRPDRRARLAGVRHGAARRADPRVAADSWPGWE
jgi:hypothetical protein